MRFSFETGAIRLGRYRGIPIHLHANFFIAAILLTFPLWRSVRLSGLAVAAIVIAVLFASILLHELAHAMVARRYHIKADRIDINIYGGVVHLAGGWRTMGQDFAITIAGPFSNLALGLAAFGLLKLVQDPDAAVFGTIRISLTLPGILERILWATTYLNFGLCVVNLLPGIPLDGGRLLYLLVEHHQNSRIAVRVVAALGLVFATLNTFIFVGTLLAGFPIWAPPNFRTNWRAFQEARTRSAGWNAFAV